MKINYFLLYIALLTFWTCENSEQKNMDTNLPNISITSHQAGEFVNEISTIKVSIEDNIEIYKVNFYVDDSLFFIDLESPYQFDWNTINYIDSSKHVIKVVCYYSPNNYAEIEPIILLVDNSDSRPLPSQIYKILYYDGFLIKWSMNDDDDFF